MSNLQLADSEIDYLLSTEAIRERAGKIAQLTIEGKGCFDLHAEKLPPTVDYVLRVIHKKYPDLNIPFHSRWGHFRAGGIDRALEFERSLGGVDQLEKARCRLDLVITSVLLDAGAGGEWSYREASSRQKFSRSEGLGVASYHMFCSGAMAADHKSLRADREGLLKIASGDLCQHFQVSEKNPLVGVEGRVQLLNGLADALANRKIFKDSRPGNILDYLLAKCGKSIPATGVLRAVLDGFGSIWPGRLVAGQVNLGDVWAHPGLGPAGSFQSLVPIHKLSQWMTYSLIEPILHAGFQVTGVEQLTGLAEYRNGGLLIDSGILSLRNARDVASSWPPDSALIVEWRALTIHLLDQIAAEVQKALGKTAREFPLAKVLEGGTWWAGRSLAQDKRPGGLPPLNIKSDGTVF